MADVTLDPDVLARWNAEGKRPQSVLRESVEEAFRCGKALICSRRWDPEPRIGRATLPTYG